jgi:hypothetical protein
MFVGHRFERTIMVSRFGQTSGVQQQEILGAKNLPRTTWTSSWKCKDSSVASARQRK